MRDFFSVDSTFMRWSNKIADLFLLNIIVIIFCLPIFTVGASLTAMHHVLVKIYKDEINGVLKTFWEAWKRNFKQATFIWILYLFIGVVLLADYYCMIQGIINASNFMKSLIVAITLFVFITMTNVFILLSRYDNTIRETMKNAVIIGLLHPLYSFAMVLIEVLSIVLCFILPSIELYLLLFGFSLPGILQTKIYVRVFDELESKLDYF